MKLNQQLKAQPKVSGDLAASCCERRDRDKNGDDEYETPLGSPAVRREELLGRFERSGLSAAEFARQQGLNDTTFCGWRKRWERARALPAFVQVEVAPGEAIASG